MIFKSHPDFTNELRYKIDDMRYLRTAVYFVLLIFYISKK